MRKLLSRNRRDKNPEKEKAEILQPEETRQAINPRAIPVSGDWFNVFNSQRAISLDQTLTINSGATGVDPVTNPFYGSALLIQAPSSFRFGAKFTF